MKKKAIIIWLCCVCVTIIATLFVGGVTRLTGSGLSIVNWQPIMGVLPPLSTAAWERAFTAYQQFPQYKLINSTMTMHEFKWIFFWEYLHRMLGRLIGVVFLVPFAVFLCRKAFDARLGKKLFVALILGGLQGALGWYMVKSGLVNRPNVSHYRLAAHLSLALFILIYLFWIVLDLWPRAVSSVNNRRYLMFGSFAVTGLVMFQIIYGAFMAGLRAGIGYNTFPKMNGEWVPAGLGYLKPTWTNLVENAVTVQFVHRTLAWLILVSVSILWVVGRQHAASPLKRALNLLMIAVAIQFSLGVLTLVLIVPVPIASVHQLGACGVLLATIYLNHLLARHPQKAALAWAPPN